MKSSRMKPEAKALRKVTIDARRIKHTIPARPLAASDLLIGATARSANGYFGGGKYIPAGRLRNVPLTNR